MATISSTNKLLRLSHLFFLVLINFAIDEAAFRNIQDVICGVPTGGYSIQTLIQPESWSLNYTKNASLCINGTGTPSTGCDFLFSFCHAFNCSKNDSSLMNTTACINTVANGKPSTSYKLGSYDPTKNPFKDDPDGKGLKFFVQFIKGSVYQTPDNEPCALSMDMHFSCNQSSTWRVSADEHNSSHVDVAVLKEIQYDANICKYTLLFDYNGACAPVAPLPTDNTVPLSAGSVLIIIFFVAISVYCIFGATFNFCRGNRGKEVIPQSEFWTQLPINIADGFIFTCGGCKSNSSDGKSTYDSI